MWPGLVNDGIQISSSLVAEDKTLLCPLPVPNQTGHFGCLGGGALIPSPKAVGLECVPPTLSYISFLLSLQIPCSPVVAKLICNSCAPYPPPTRPREIKKSPKLLPCWAYVIGLGVNEKSTKCRGTYAQLFQHFIHILSPLPLTWALLFF